MNILKLINKFYKFATEESNDGDNDGSYGEEFNPYRIMSDELPSFIEEAMNLIEKDLGHTIIEYIASGSYSSVFKIRYNDGMAVAKVTRSRSDATKAAHLNVLKEEMPYEYRRYFPEVYDITHIKQFYVIITEFLIDLPKNMALENWGIEFEGKRHKVDKRKNLENLVNNDGFMKDAIAYSVRHYQSMYSDIVISEQEVKKLSNIIYDIIMATDIEKIYEAFINTNFLQLSNNIADMAYDAIYLDEAYEGIDGTRLNSFIGDSVFYFFKEILNDAISKTIFPESSEEKTRKFLTEKLGNEKIKRLLSFIEYLKNEHSIYWNDLRDFNVMMRPGTGDLVLSDVGLFELKDLQVL